LTPISRGRRQAEKSLAHLLAANLAVRVATMPAGEDPDSLIRKRGPDAFRERITAAKDYFDFQIDRETARPEFASPRGRVAAARKLAGAVSLLSDPVLRATVTNRAAMRLEISPEEFARLLAAPKVDNAPVALDGTAASLQPIELDPTIRLLCTVALRDEAARSWLLEEHWPEMLEQEPGAELLMKILAADLRADETPSIQGFLDDLGRRRRKHGGGPSRGQTAGQRADNCARFLARIGATPHSPEDGCLPCQAAAGKLTGFRSGEAPERSP
jgi:DNA primase